MAEKAKADKKAEQAQWAFGTWGLPGGTCEVPSASFPVPIFPGARFITCWSSGPPLAELRLGVKG